MHYGSDCAPCRTVKRYVAVLDEFAIRRSGRICEDLLVQRLFLVDSDYNATTVLVEPRQLANQTCSPHFEAWPEILPTPRQLGHRDILVTHHVWDGAIFSAMRRLVKKQNEAERIYWEAELGDDEAYRLWLLRWPGFTTCMAHVTHNSLKWGCRRQMDRAVLKSAYICLESLRSGYAVLEASAPRWIASALDFHDWHIECVQLLWTSLGLSGALLDSLIDLQIRFSGGQLLVAEVYRNEPNIDQHVYAVLLAVWRFETFTDSRWNTLGQASKSLLATAIVGIEPLVQYIMKQAHTSTCYTRGFAGHYVASVRELLAVLATSSFVADAVLTLLQEDDRIARVVEDIDRELVHELEYIGSLPLQFWEIVGEAVGMAPRALQNASLSSAAAQASHINRHLREAHKRPWCLLQGDINANLDTLRVEMAEPTGDEITRKLWLSLQRGYPRGQLLQALELLRNVSWTSLCVEQGHSKPAF